MRLLIAEDELDLAEALSVLFEKNQFSVDVVNDGLSAYDYASGGDYDTVILDVMMPGLNGLEVLRRLREEGVKTPVMMLSSRRAARRMTASLASTPGRTTICPSPSSRTSSLRVCARCCAAAGPTPRPY